MGVYIGREGLEARTGCRRSTATTNDFVDVPPLGRSGEVEGVSSSRSALGERGTDDSLMIEWRAERADQPDAPPRSHD